MTTNDDGDAEAGAARTAARIGGATALLLLVDLRRPSEATTLDTVEELLMSD